jgi:nicotinamide-nucleotide amidase
MPTIQEEVGQLLRDKGLTIAVAEACTAGLIGSLLCSVPGSSRYLYGGVIAYTGGSKTRVLGVPEDLLQRESSVSTAVALEMARRAQQLFDADVGVSTTGVAGPTGGSSDRPIGLFYIGVAARDGHEAAKELRWNGNRNPNRENTAEAALELVKEYLVQKS